MQYLGTVEKIQFKKPGFCVCTFRIEAIRNLKGEESRDLSGISGKTKVKTENIVCLKITDRDVEEGNYLSVEGVFVRTPEKMWKVRLSYEYQLEAKKVNIEREFSEADGMLAFLESEIDGIGNKTARLIIEKAGGGEGLRKILEIHDIAKIVEDLSGIPRFGEAKIRSLKEQWDMKRGFRDALMYLEGECGITGALAHKVINQFSGNIRTIMEEQPYKLTEIDGIGFKKADEIAMRMGLDKRSPQRFEALISYIAKEASDSGHTLVGLDWISWNVENYFRNDREILPGEYHKIALSGIESCLSGGSLVKINENVFQHTWAHSMERWIASELIRKRDSSIPMAPIGIPDNGLTIEQAKAVRGVFRNKLSIINGAAGTGKTFTIGTVLEELKKRKEPFAVLCPSNTAAKIIRERNPGMTVGTIHSILQIAPGQEPRFNTKNPIPYSTIIVDEGSMCDQTTFYQMLKSLSPDTRLVLVGDWNQLPPVGSGSVFADMIRCGAFDGVLYTLTVVKRTEKSIDAIPDENQIIPGVSNITANSQRILEGKFPIPRPDTRIVFFKKNGDTQKIFEKNAGGNSSDELDLIFEQLDDGFDNQSMTIERNSYTSMKGAAESDMRDVIRKGLDPLRDWQIFVPLWKTQIGVDALNLHFQEKLKGTSPVVYNDEKRGISFRLGDKLALIGGKVGDFVKGETGIAVGYKKENDSLLVKFFSQKNSDPPIEIPKNEIKNFTLGYAMTVHRAQGMEVKHSTTILPGAAYRLLCRENFYTAYTRGKSQSNVYAEQSAMSISLQKTLKSRDTYLFHLLAGTPKAEIVLNNDFGLLSAQEKKFIKENLREKYQCDTADIIRISCPAAKGFAYIFSGREHLKYLGISDGVEIEREVFINITKDPKVIVFRYYRDEELTKFDRSIIANPNCPSVNILRINTSQGRVVSEKSLPTSLGIGDGAVDEAVTSRSLRI